MSEPTCFSLAQGKILVISFVCARGGENRNFMNHTIKKNNSDYTINNTAGLKILTQDH